MNRNIYLLAFLMCISTSLLFGQSSVKPLHLVQQQKQMGATFPRVELFHTNLGASIKELDEAKTPHQILQLDDPLVDQVFHIQPERLLLPIKWQDEILELELVKVNIHASDFQVVESATNKAVEVNSGVHYRGVLKNDKSAIVAMSFSDSEIMGLISSAELGNLVLGKSTSSETVFGEHIIYNDKNLLEQFDLECSTKDDGPGYTREELSFNPGRAAGDCVRLYFEVDNDIHNNKGGIAGTTSFVNGIFNQVSTLYANENINTVISEIFIWSTPSPYNSNSSSGMLSAFQNFRTNWNGDLAQLLSYKASGGIAAGFNGICNNNRAASMSFASINTGYNIVPNYSWTIMVVTHEFGHLFGSRHTHACVWNGNNTAIDGCAGSTEGSCPLPGLPSQGGTIMSYCHITSVGINFNEGFGPQPGNVIRNKVASVTCTVSCGPPTCDDGVQNGNETGVDCGGPDCPACPSCNDGIQNGDELGVDCGGPDCTPCPCNNDFTLTINLDDYPEETTWEVRDLNGNVWVSGGPYGNQPDGSTVVEPICLPDGCYDFIIFDSYGDGICCGYGNGSYVLVENATGNVIASGGNFDNSQTTPFCADSTPLPSCTDGIQNGDEQGIDCGGSNCPPCIACTDHTLTIVLDQGPQQTTWTLSDAFGIVLYFGGPYSESGATIVENFCLDDGCYTFAIYDSNSNGICCRSGVGNYTFENANGVVIASGSAFGASDITNFCVGDGGNGPTCFDGIQNGDEEGVDCGGSCPTACPTCDDGIQNGDETGVDCGGSDCPPCDMCNDGVQNGDEEGVDCGGSCPTACPTCDDGIQNGDEEGVDCGGSNCPACPSANCNNPVILNSEDFEAGFGIWNDGGGDCRRSSADSEYAYSGTFCIRLRDNSSTSILTSDQFNYSDYSAISVDFTYVGDNMEFGEEFLLELSVNGGSSYTPIQSWSSGSEFANGEREFESVVIQGPFSTGTRLRFRCDASSNSDFVYLDDIVINYCDGAASLAPANNDMERKDEIVPSLSALRLFPNPTDSDLNVRFETQALEEIQVLITDLNGKIVSQQKLVVEDGEQQFVVDGNRLEAGIYFLHLLSSQGRKTEKFVIVR